jgi:hypothetical protein
MYSKFTQPTYPIRMLFTIDPTMKESQKNKMVKEDGMDKLAVLEQRMKTFEGTRLHDHIKAVEMCLMPNVIIPKFLKYLNSSNIQELNAL